MPETKRDARAHARRVHIPVSHVVRAPGTKHYYIAPRGVTSHAGRMAYASARESGRSAAYSARVAHAVQRRNP